MRRVDITGIGIGLVHQQVRRLTMGLADDRAEADGEVVDLVKDMKVALSEA